jgi:hypothetical protein
MSHLQSFNFSTLLAVSLCKSVLRRLLQSFNFSILQFFILPHHTALHEERAECGSEYGDNEIDDFVDGFLFHIAFCFLKTERQR